MGIVSAHQSIDDICDYELAGVKAANISQEDMAVRIHKIRDIMVLVAFFALANLFMCLSFVHNSSATAILKKPTGSGKKNCHIIIWRYFSPLKGDFSRMYSQTAELAYEYTKIRDMYFYKRKFTVVYLNGKKQSFTLRRSSDSLGKIMFRCGTHGAARVKVTDCQTRAPLYNAFLSDTEKDRRWFRSHPTEKTGIVIQTCNCRPPKTFGVKIFKKGYQTKQVTMYFSGKRLDEYSFCLNKAKKPTSHPLTTKTWYWYDNGGYTGTIIFKDGGIAVPDWYGKHTWKYDSNGDLLLYSPANLGVVTRFKYNPKSKNYNGHRDKTSKVQDGVNSVLKLKRQD